MDKQICECGITRTHSTLLHKQFSNVTAVWKVKTQLMTRLNHTLDKPFFFLTLYLLIHEQLFMIFFLSTILAGYNGPLNIYLTLIVA